MAARTPKPETKPSRTVTTIYGYHPADEVTPDLFLPTQVARQYHVADTQHRLAISPSLEWHIGQNGVLTPLQIATNGMYGLIIDGSHRMRIAVKLGLKEVPVQVIPDNLARKASVRGFSVVESRLAGWIDKNLWTRHDDHEVIRHSAGGASAGGIVSNKYVRCVCSCGARWREYR
jgi:hypothetical protein